MEGSIVLTGRKFKEGDLVVVRKPMTVHRYPDDRFDARHATRECIEKIRAKEPMRFYGLPFNGPSRGMLAFGRGPQTWIDAGRTGVVKGYANVYMLDSTTRNPSENSRKYDRDSLLFFETKDSQVRLYNRHRRTFLIVLIEGMLVAVVNSAELFEHNETTLARHNDVTVKLNLKLNLKNIDPEKLQPKIDKKIAALAAMGYDVELDRVTTFDEKGQITSDSKNEKEE